MQLRNGIKTSEFWVTLLPTVIAFMVVTGVIDQGDTDVMISLTKDVVAGAIALVSIITYIVNRSSLKKEIVKASVTQNRIDNQQPKTEVQSSVG